MSGVRGVFALIAMNVCSVVIVSECGFFRYMKRFVDRKIYLTANKFGRGM